MATLRLKAVVTADRKLKLDLPEDGGFSLLHYFGCMVRKRFKHPKNPLIVETY